MNTDHNSELIQALVATPGDVLFSRERVPYPGAILMGFSESRSRNLPEFEPFVSFDRLTQLLEFLEHVVLTERIIIPVPQFSRKTTKIINSRRHKGHFEIYHAAGDLDFTTEHIVKRLADSGILQQAIINVGESTADDVAAKFLPQSKTLQNHFSSFLLSAQDDYSHDKFAVASASMAFWIGAPLHVAEAAGQAKVPYVLGPHEEKQLIGYELENLRTRSALTTMLLDRLNASAKKELNSLSQLGIMSVFPETPIASRLIQMASTPRGLVDAAIQLRVEFQSFRTHINQIEHDLANENQTLKVRLRRAKEIEHLAAAMWPTSRTDFKTTAIGVSDLLFSVPEIVSDPTPMSLKSLASKAMSLPVDKLMDIYRRRKIRLLLKAKRQFLGSSGQIEKIAKIFDVPEEIARRSRLQGRPMLTARYAAKNPELAIKLSALLGKMQTNSGGGNAA